ncbi:LytTR family DNA-binding domain-containing protein [Flavicella sp.]|uniref:LytR/AlgR family response regulator transcription factor n=1 Tax=Flavicella sp. TaxID=2957742 RepID=UPI0026204395|nr:LytTR family DNA-binding domain-containing protein [Flavicella sp.]MDG1805783.1 LytTR family DNA-binding domain-containing protein [Flavicella sp.]
MKKCILIDDDATARLITQQMISKVDNLEVVGDFENAIDAIKFLNDQSVDLIFLDIHMPTFSGFDFIKTLKSPPSIVLVTSDRNFALDAFEYNCVVDYLVKPLTFERFQKSMDKIPQIAAPSSTKTEENQETTEDKLYVNIDRRLVKIHIPDIYLIEAKGDYINIKTEGKNYIVHSTLKKIENKLPSQTFIKVHRSYIINFNKIIDIEDNSVLIKQDIIPVSRSNRGELMRRLNLL